MIIGAEQVVLPLRVKGSKPFGIFSHLDKDDDGDTLRKTWRVASKVASELEHGHRIENLSWRMWHLQDVIGSTSAKARTDASLDSIGRSLGYQLESDKKMAITELRAPAFRWTDKSDAIRHLGIMRLQQRDASRKADANKEEQTSESTSLKDRQSKGRKGTKPTIPVRRSNRHEEQICKDDVLTAKTSSRSINLAESEDDHIPNARNSPTKVCSEERIPIALSDSRASHSNDSASGSSSILSSGDSIPPKSLSYPSKRVKKDSSHETDSGRQSSSPPVCWQLTEAAAKQKLLTKRLLEKTAAEKEKHADKIAQGQKKSKGEVDTSSSHPVKPSMWTLEEVEMAERELLEQGVDFTGPFAAMLADLKQGLLTRVQSGSPTEADHTSQIALTSMNHQQYHLPHQQSHLHYTHTSQAHPQMQPNHPPNYGSPSSIHTVPAHTSGASMTNDAAHGFSLPASPSVNTSQSNGVYGNWSHVTRQHSYHAPQSGPSRHDHRRSSSIQMPYPTSTAIALSSNAVTEKSMVPFKAEEQDGGEDKGQVRKAQCANCGATSTPLWRRDVNFDLQCNACGLYYKLHNAPRPISLKNRRGQSQRSREKGNGYDVNKKKMRIAMSPSSRRSSASSGSANCEWLGIHAGAACANCGTTKTPLWRKDAEQRVICNACGLYSKMHKADRPADMRADNIRRRSRHDDRQRKALEQMESSNGIADEIGSMIQQGETSMGYSMPLQPSHSQVVNTNSMQTTTASTSAIHIPAELWDHRLCPMGAWGENCCQNLPPPEDVSPEQLLQQQAILEQLGMNSFPNATEDMPMMTSPSNHTIGSLDAETMASILGDDWLVNYTSAPANTPAVGMISADDGIDATQMTTSTVVPEVVGPSYQIKRRKMESAISPTEWWTIPTATSTNNGEGSQEHQQE